MILGLTPCDTKKVTTVEARRVDLKTTSVHDKDVAGVRDAEVAQRCDG